MEKIHIISTILFLLFQQILTQNSSNLTTDFDSTTTITTSTTTVTTDAPLIITENVSLPPPKPTIEDRCPPLTNNMDSLTQEQFTSILTDTCRYDKLIKPPTNNPLSVYVQIDLLHIESVEQLQFKAHMLIQYLYRDDRLQFETISPNRGVILGEQLLRDKIWVPHLMIRNQKDTRLMGIDGKDVFVSISPQGDVVYSYRMTATFYCWMNLQKFPFDSQDCTIRWNSWTYNTTHLLLQWDKDVPVKIANNLHLTEFELIGTSTEANEVPSSFTKGAFVGNFSELVFHFRLSRQVGYYILDYFLPSILLVCISWVSFWLQADAGPPRTVLGTSTMLSLITLNGSLKRNLPKVSYIKSSEIWFLTCVCFIFCSLAEFAFVNVIWRRKKKVELQKRTSKYILRGAITPSLVRRQLQKSQSSSSIETTTTDTETSRTQVPIIRTPTGDDLDKDPDKIVNIPVSDNGDDGGNKPPVQTWHTMTPHEVAIWIDRKSRIVFPLSFIVFNIFYWSFVYII